MFDQNKLSFVGDLTASNPEINLNIDTLKKGNYVLNIMCGEKIIKSIKITKA